MFKEIKAFFNKPIETVSSSKDRWIFIVFVSLFVTLFLLVFQPFGINNFDPTHSISQAFLFSVIGFGAVIGLALGVFEFIIGFILFKKQTLLVFFLRTLAELVFVATVIFLYYNVLGNFHDWHFKSYIDFIFNVSIMSVIPIYIILLYIKNRKTKQAYQLLELKPKLELANKYVSLQSSNGKDSISLTLNDLLFVEAEDNYISVSYIERDQLKKQLLRATMKEVEMNLNSEFVLRCHRSFIVNMNKVDKVIKDGHQIKLFIPELSFPIIVSRSYVPKIKALLDTHHK